MIGTLVSEKRGIVLLVVTIIVKLRDFEILTPILNPNGDFALIFLTLQFYLCFLKMKAPFARDFNSVSWMPSKN